MLRERRSPFTTSMYASGWWVSFGALEAGGGKGRRDREGARRDREGGSERMRREEGGREGVREREGGRE